MNAQDIVARTFPRAVLLAEMGNLDGANMLWVKALELYAAQEVAKEQAGKVAKHDFYYKLGEIFGLSRLEAKERFWPLLYGAGPKRVGEMLDG